MISSNVDKPWRWEVAARSHFNRQFDRSAHGRDAKLKSETGCATMLVISFGEMMGIM